MIDLGKMNSFHLVGIGGSGMSAIARLLHEAGFAVTGSDRLDSPSLQSLADLGLEVWPGSDPDRIGGVDAVVASSAVPTTDREMTVARERGLVAVDRPQLLGAISRIMPAIGVAGTHGKTISTSMLITAMRSLGIDPSFIVGSPLLDEGVNGHKGSSDLLIIEADEAFGTFLHLTLQGLVITNVEADHLDHYQTTDQLHRAFVEVGSAVDGPVLICRDDAGARRVGGECDAVTYGVDTDSDWVITRVRSQEGGSVFDLRHDDTTHGVHLPRVGMHDVRNAAGVLALIGELGHDVTQAAHGLSQFAGVARRFESHDPVAGVRVIDDYAHHPTELDAVITAAQETRPNRLWVVFQPHLYSRTRDHLTGFAKALSQADEVVLTDIFPAREAPIPGVDGTTLAKEMDRTTDTSVTYIPDREYIAGHLAGRVVAGDTVLVLGAGDIYRTTAELLKLLGGDT